jgi:2-octaprenyl-6-methoxyphenol hydroxylase
MGETELDPAERTELAVIGAGPVGTSLAILAAQAGFAVTLIDARPETGAGRKPNGA